MRHQSSSKLQAIRYDDLGKNFVGTSPLVPSDRAIDDFVCSIFMRGIFSLRPCGQDDMDSSADKMSDLIILDIVN